jgi:hypothetical protein
MKNLILHSLLILGILSCEQGYQKSAVDLSPDNNRNIRNSTSNNKTFNQNIQNYLDNFVRSKNDGSADTLVDYKKLFETKNTSNTLELRENLYTQIAKAKYDIYTKNEKVSFLINTYNFLVIETIIENYIKNGQPITSINDIGPKDFWAFGNISYTVAGEKKTLDQIEKQTLKPLLTFPNGTLDARFHFVAICGAKGCPILMADAYNAKDLDFQLTNATMKGLELSRNLDTSSGGLKLTELFKWYAADFSNHSEDGIESTGNIRKFIQKYAPSANTTGTISYTQYDWALNILN